MRRAATRFRDRISYRYVVANGAVFRLRPVNSEALMAEGWAALEGSAVLHGLREAHRKQVDALAMASQGIDPEAIAELQDRQAKLRNQQAMEMMDAAGQSLESSKALADRMRAHVCAAVDGTGVVDPESWPIELWGPLGTFVGLMEASWGPAGACLDLRAVDGSSEPGAPIYIDPCKVLRDAPCKPGESEMEATQRANDAGDLVYAQLDPSERQTIFLASLAMSRGRAQRAAAFRVGSSPSA